MMAGIGSKNTKPEIAVRKILHARGFRFRLHKKGLPGKPDIVLPKYATIIFVQGCFWHGHENCSQFRIPHSRSEFWESKIGSNKARDRRVRSELAATGWSVVDIWECALKGPGRMDPAALALQIEETVVRGVAAQIRGATYLE